MLAVDTNALLRLLLDDDEEQGRIVRSLFRSGEPLFVSHLVLVEAAWVVVSGYGFSRAKLAGFLERVLDADGLVVQDPESARAALSAFVASRADFSDCLILVTAHGAGASALATFDEKLAKLPGTRRLGQKRRRAPK
jgi:predicted nucleic-acid-binding protein